MQEIFEYREIKKYFTHFTTKTHGPQGFHASYVLILWLLLLSFASGTSKSLPFPHIHDQEIHRCIAEHTHTAKQ